MAQTGNSSDSEGLTPSVQGVDKPPSRIGSKVAPASPEASLRLHTVFVLDDDEAEVTAVKAALEGDGFACTTFTDPRRCVDELRSNPCDVLVCDLVMPHADGLQVLSQAREAHPGLPVIVVTGHGNIAIAVTAMKKGACDFIEKPFDRAALTESINNALNYSRREWATATVELSKMERTILRHILRGNGNKRIAQMIGRSVRTVEDHRSHIMKKMGVSNVVELVRRCIDMDLV
ncbi:MAG TPA: response regulator [Sedimentisphaerales bacterium]|nr:response regulator [Sedimentisphaerales bacterium]